MFDDDDIIMEPQHLDEGIYGDDISDLCVGDFHQLALSKTRKQLYAWGSGVLGNGTDLFSAEPIKIVLPHTRKVMSIHISGNTSAVVLDYNGIPEVYIWRYLLLNSEVFKALSPSRVLGLKVHR
jgi:hypothetical protein